MAAAIFREASALTHLAGLRKLTSKPAMGESSEQSNSGCKTLKDDRYLRLQLLLEERRENGEVKSKTIA